MQAEPSAKEVQIDWHQPVSVLRPQFSEIQARRAGVSRYDLAHPAVPILMELQAFIAKKMSKFQLFCDCQKMSD